jgi:hypothetical protein
MQTLNNKSRFLFLQLVNDVTLTNSAEIQIRGKIAVVVELMLDIPDTRNGRLKKYVISNYQTDLPFVPEMGFLVLDNQAPWEVNYRKIAVLPEWVWNENTAEREVSAIITRDRDIIVVPELNSKHCQLAAAWLDKLEEDGFGQTEEQL